ncbi:MAG: hypothetical protein CMN72_16025 [Sphingomonas sp.]|nr:hypothetical protein [Sphingomonas sp.]|tara:strand:+ start:2408 stop:2587 length:180 start_codon:yes stop_codon:yes gene_type:complete
MKNFNTETLIKALQVAFEYMPKDHEINEENYAENTSKIKEDVDFVKSTLKEHEGKTSKA